MSVEFVDTNVFVYAHERGAGLKHRQAVDLVTRLFEEQAGAVSIQVLSEFYVTATKKLGMKSEESEEAIADLGVGRFIAPDTMTCCALAGFIGGTKSVGGMRSLSIAPSN